MSLKRTIKGKTPGGGMLIVNTVPEHVEKVIDRLTNGAFTRLQSEMTKDLTNLKNWWPRDTGKSAEGFFLEMDYDGEKVSGTIYNRAAKPGEPTAYAWYVWTKRYLPKINQRVRAWHVFRKEWTTKRAIEIGEDIIALIHG